MPRPHWMHEQRVCVTETFMVFISPPMLAVWLRRGYVSATSFLDIRGLAYYFHVPFTARIDSENDLLTLY